MIIALVIILLALIICATFIVLLKKDIRQLNRSLQATNKTDTNTRLTTETFDKDICDLCNLVNDTIDKQKEAIIVVEKANSEFIQAITNVSHDLRTPLTASIGYIQLARSDKTSLEKRGQYLDIVEKRLKDLSDMLNTLFEYTQIVEGKTELNIKKTNVCNLICDVMSMFYNDFSCKSFDINVDIPDTPVYIMCDIAALKRVAQNLIRNSLEHGYGFFGLTVEENGRIVFVNRVPTTSEPDVGRIFDRFYTVDYSRNNENVGLGLAIAKKLVDNMGGQINAFLDGDMLKMTVDIEQNIIPTLLMTGKTRYS